MIKFTPPEISSKRYNMPIWMKPFDPNVPASPFGLCSVHLMYSDQLSGECRPNNATEGIRFPHWRNVDRFFLSSHLD